MFQERERDHICGCAKCTSPIKDYKYRATLKKEAADYSEMLVNTKPSLHGYTVHQRYQSFIVQLMHIHSLLKQLKL